MEGEEEAGRRKTGGCTTQMVLGKFCRCLGASHNLRCAHLTVHMHVRCSDISSYSTQLLICLSSKNYVFKYETNMLDTGKYNLSSILHIELKDLVFTEYTFCVI